MKPIKIAILFVFLFAALTANAFAFKGETVRGNVIRVTDGDTVVIQPEEGGQFFKCRLYGIDAPETKHGRREGQPYGEEAAKELKHLILGQEVEVIKTGAKTYKRDVCMIKKDDADINLEMVKRGYAWAYVQYLKRPHASEYIDAESQARSKRLGLWKDNNPTPPWEFRKLQRHRR